MNEDERAEIGELEIEVREREREKQVRLRMKKAKFYLEVRDHRLRNWYIDKEGTITAN